MTMTKRERLGKEQIQKYLSEQGYPTYARLFGYFEFNITHDPEVVGYMIPDKGKIVVNADRDMDEISVIVRHEILHEYLTHQIRLLKNLAKRKGLDYDKLDDLSIKELSNELEGYRKGPYSLGNWAGDYEISNRGYTEADKEIIRNLHGLVTEDDHPGWENLSVEELFDELMKEIDQQKQDAKNNPPEQKGDENGEGDESGESGSDQNSDHDWSPENSKSGSSSGGKGEGIKIVKGTFKNGKFYDLNGEEITHKEN